MRHNPQPPTGQRKLGRGSDPTGKQQDRQTKQEASRPHARTEAEQGRYFSQPRTGRTSREGSRGGTESGALEPPPQIEEDLGRQH